MTLTSLVNDAATAAQSAAGGLIARIPTTPAQAANNFVNNASAIAKFSAGLVGAALIQGASGTALPSNSTSSSLSDSSSSTESHSETWVNRTASAINSASQSFASLAPSQTGNYTNITHPGNGTDVGGGSPQDAWYVYLGVFGALLALGVCVAGAKGNDELLKENGRCI